MHASASRVNNVRCLTRLRNLSLVSSSIGNAWGPDALKKLSLPSLFFFCGNLIYVLKRSMDNSNVYVDPFYRFYVFTLSFLLCIFGLGFSVSWILLIDRCMFVRFYVLIYVFRFAFCFSVVSIIHLSS